MNETRRRTRPFQWIVLLWILAASPIRSFADEPGESGDIGTEQEGFEKPRPTPPYTREQPLDHSKTHRIYVIPIQDEIGWSTEHHVRRAVEEAREAGAAMILLDMDTPGGLVDAAVKIKDLLLKVRFEMETATFANSRAISAGALLAISTQMILMTENGVLGDAAPILVGHGAGGGVEWDAPEKILSYVRSQFVSTAEIMGYDTDVVTAMVDKARPVPGLTQEGELLILRSSNAREWGISRGTVSNLEEAIEALGYVNYVTVLVEKNWAENLAGFLAKISGLLIAIGIVALFVEARTPGIGVPLAIAIACFFIVFWANRVAGLAGYEAVILLVIGMTLLAIELFVTPGFGFMGVSGLALITLSLILALLRVAPSSPVFRFSDLALPLVTVILAFGAASVGILFLASMLPRSGMFRRLVLASTQDRGEGYVATEESAPDLVGQRGTAYTTLRPAGTGLIGGKRMDVVAEGSFIPRGASIRVIRIEGRRIVVKGD